ncbi:c-type cytochrome [Rhizobium tubonense]|uniref:c-type cytochrome n=1 Tax=Rhizobium tubonense TaxID=484088 RepID=UPI001FCECF66|nr:cytochrome c [Rhizobium tubonense]
MRSGYSVSAALLFACLCLSATTAQGADGATVARGKYLVQFGGCSDCHTPGYFLGKVDMSRYLGGSDVGFRIPPGTFVGPNLTPDKETGLGKWSVEDIVKALRTGVTPEGRVLAEIMPWKDFAHLTIADSRSIALYLKSLPPISNKVPEPLGPKEKPTFPVLAVVAP